jgi:hypothetical protein
MINPVLLWLGVLGGPVAFALVRLAGVVLLTGSCRPPAENAVLVGLSSNQLIMAAITILCALIAGASGVLSWHIWRSTRQRTEHQTGESLRPVPFWAIGGLFLSSVFFVLIIFTGGLALGLSTTCVS